MSWRKTLYPCLPGEIADALRAQTECTLRKVEEIRAYTGCPLELTAAGKRIHLPVIMDAAGMERLLAALSGYALYRCEQELAQGYLPITGGHRAGVCGRMVLEDGRWRMGEVTSLCIRISRRIPGAGAHVYGHLLGEDGRALRTLFLGIPGSGKTTVLRDAASYLAQTRRLQVAAADERGELFAGDIPPGMDVLSGMDKAQAMSMLLRSMAPQVIVTDEIGRMEDAQAMEDAARCGVGLLASAHAGSLAECACRPLLRRLMDNLVFDRYVLLKRDEEEITFQIWNQNGQELTCEEGVFDGQSGRSDDSDDCH